MTLTDFDRQSLIFIDNNIAGVELIRLQNKVKNTCQTLNITYTNDIASALILVNALQGITFGLNFIYTRLNEALTQVPLQTSPEVTYGAVINSHNERKIVKEFIKFIQNEV